MRKRDAEGFDRVEEIHGHPVDGRLPQRRGREGDRGGHLGEAPGRTGRAASSTARISDAPASDCGWRRQKPGGRRGRRALVVAAAWLSRSSTIASTTMASPASMACADLQRAQRQQHVVAEAAGADHRGDDHHVQRQHDDLVDADHQRRPRRRDAARATASAAPCSRPCRRTRSMSVRHARQRRAWSPAPSAASRRCRSRASPRPGCCRTAAASG